MIKKSKEFITKSKFEFEPLPQLRSRKRKLMPGEHAIDEVVTDPIENFKINTYYATIDCIDTQLRERFIGQSNSINHKNPDKTTLGLLKDIGLLSKKRFNEVQQNPECFPKDAFNVFCKLYNKFVNAETARKEYLEFCKYLDILEECKTLPTILHGKSELNETSETSDSDISLEYTEKSGTDNMGINCIQSKHDKIIKNHSSLITIFK